MIAIQQVVSLANGDPLLYEALRRVCLLVPPPEPPGVIKDYAGTVAPEGYLMADGQAVSRVLYPALFDVIGTRFGAGNGWNTFNVPDLRGRLALGRAVSGTGATLGETGGAINHTHTVAAGAAHHHSVSVPNHNHTASVPAHTHDVVVPDHYHVVPSLTLNTDGPSSTTGVAAGGGETVASDIHSHNGATSEDATGDHQFGTITTTTKTSESLTSSTQVFTAFDTADNTATSGTSGAANPPFMALNKIIKT